MSETKLSNLSFLETVGLSVIAAPFIALLIPLCSMPFMLLDTWVFIRLWRWFIEPTLHIAAPPFWMAMGVWVFASFLISRHAEDTRKWHERVIQTIAKPLSFLLIGWITHRIFLNW